MIEFALGVIVGLLVMGLIDEKIRIGKKPVPQEPTEQEVRKAERAAREYMNFMNYSGDPQDDIH